MSPLTRFTVLTAVLCTLPAAYAQNHPTTPDTGEVSILNSDRNPEPENVEINVYEIFVDNAPPRPFR